MSLTAGAKLQNGKYLIQSLLHQTDASVSYQAVHTSLNHPVVIHTLNPSLQQSPRFDSVRQQFLATVKQGQFKAAIVRDCFEENNLPYVVLEPTPTPIQLTDWMPFLTPAVLGAPATIGNSADNSVNRPAAAPVAAAIVPPAQTSPAQTSLSFTPVAAPQLPTLPPEPIAASTASTASPSAPPAPSRFPRWLPIALLLTAGTAGLTGAAIGWRFRSGAAAPNPPALFSREQSFPEKTDWLGEDPYADSDRPEDFLDSASPAVERRSTTRRRAIEPEPEYYEPQPRSRSRQAERSDPEQPRSRSRSERQPEVETKPEAEAPKVESLPDPAPLPEAPAPAPVPQAEPPAPEPVEIPSPKVQLVPPAEPISQ